ncbi:MAG TPA: response regulator transcription factor [Candidatus Omnitrophota bacterium]|nr:response regulator transcription factor [Candidatus Omnitrophota bacterium]HQJ14954.1 response regulator transcription factor [Candidatus Omnitrophota bacterium]
MRILLVEDELRIASFIQRGLKEEDYVVDVAHDGEKGLYLAEINPYDLIILDIILPVKDGVSVCRELRRKKINAPILMLTSKDGVRDKVLGLNSGADDYLAKPFDFEELLARIAALLRRNKIDKTGLLKVADLELDRTRHKVARAGKDIVLTSKEFALLEYLMDNAGHAVTRTMISEHVWHEDFDNFTNVIDVYMSFLRSKIDKGHKKQLIHTIHGKGYIVKEA